MPASTPITCIVVDDDEIDRLTTVAFVKQFPSLHLLEVYSSPAEFLAANTSLPQVLFLDVDMPGMSGLELRKQLMAVPACVFVTAYPDYAVESFELDALDYLVKPLKMERFAMTVQRIQTFIDVRERALMLSHTLGADSIFIKEGYEQIKISLHEVLYLEALKDYTRIVRTGQSHCVLSNLGELLKQPAFQSFTRIHKSYAVQHLHIQKYNSTHVEIAGFTLPIGRAYKTALSHLQNKS